MARQITERIKKVEAAKLPPTADELRGYDIKMIGLRRKAIDSLTVKFNSNMEHTNQVKDVLLHSEKIKRLYQGIEYLGESLITRRK